MKAFVATLCSIISLALCTSWACAGDVVVGSFAPGKAPGVEHLAHVEVKGLVAEFLDPGDTGLGKSVAYLLWREILTAISDQAGAGVILAHPPDNRRLTDMLRNDYHRAAVEIARSQRARLVLWGAVNESKDKIYVQNFLTLLPELIQDDLHLTLRLMGRPEQSFSVEIPRTRYNLAVVETSRPQLFERVLIARSSASVYERPGGGSREVKRVAAGEALRSVDMEGAWFKVRFKDGSTGWIENTQVEVPPRAVYADSRGVNVRHEPAGATALGTVNLRGIYQVLDSRFVPGKGSWYRLDLPGGPGWIAAFLVEPLFSLPAVQFTAGLYRYQCRNFAEAHKAFAAYLRRTSGAGERVNLAAAYQLYGASTLMLKSISPDDFRRGIDAMDKASLLTPFDPAVYNLRALTRVAATLKATDALNDLEEALKLDRFNAQSQSLLAAFAAWADTSNRDYDFMRNWVRLMPQDAKKISALQAQYKVPTNPH
jgi:hypothetical protein